MILLTNVSFSQMNQSDSSHLMAACGSVAFRGLLERFAWMFYLITPNSSSYLNADDVPNYEVQIFPILNIILLLEQLVRFAQKRRFSRSSDFLVNIGAGFLFTICRVALLGTVLQLFTFLYDNYRLVDLPPQGLSTWVLSLLLVELVYYWIHRCLHEVNLFWAAHQFHHNAVEIDVSTTFRDSLVDLVIYEFFPAPLALLIPPPILLVHMQFSLIYQIWLHTEVIGHLGPLEYLINTPRQHRVHHGKNPYCIDKNYGALLMIWDRLFGTYQAEEEAIRFGTTKKGYETFDSVTLHFYYYYDVLWAKVRRMECWTDRVKAVFYGPGWEPGKPRTGLLSDIPKVDLNAPIERYDREIPFWATFYVIVHAFLIALGAYIITDRPLVRHSPLNALLLMLYILLALTVFGTIFDRRAIIAPLLESLRCALFFPFDVYIISSWTTEAPTHLSPLIQVTLTLVRLIHLVSLILWLAIAVRDLAFFQMKPSVSDSKEQIQKVMKPPSYTNSLEVNPRAAWQMAIYVLLISTIALPLILALYALNFTECQQILRHTLSQQIEL